MNENPWRVDDIARVQRERIREEVRQVRAVDAANRAGLARPVRGAGIPGRVLLVVKGWFRRAHAPRAASRAGEAPRQA